jgi:hypothetical protein
MAFHKTIMKVGQERILNLKAWCDCFPDDCHENKHTSIMTADNQTRYSKQRALKYKPGTLQILLSVMDG